MKKLIPFLLLLMLLNPAAALAGPAEIEAGIKPDSRFYWFDRLAEQITLVLTFNPQSKSAALSRIALERLAEAEGVASGKTVGDLISDYQRNRDKAYGLAGKDVDALTGLNDDQAQALELLNHLFDEGDGVAEQKVAKAMTSTTRLLTKQAKKLEQVTRSDSPRAAEKTAKVLDKTTTRLNRLADKLTKQSNETSATAGKKTREELAEHVRSATAKHLSVLDGLLQKVPGSATGTIEKAIERSGNGHKTAGNAVKRRGPKTGADNSGSADADAVNDEDDGEPKARGKR